MILQDLPDDEINKAIDSGEFSQSILTATKDVAIVMTQSWCPDWLFMKTWLVRAGRKTDVGTDVTVFIVVYDKIDRFDEFRQFKETTFGNHQIPYVRYYRDGQPVGDSNAVTRKGFLSRFEA